jgi:integrase
VTPRDSGLLPGYASHIVSVAGDDMARRRLQQNGDLYQQGGWWKLRWREDQLDGRGKQKRGWSRPVWIGPAAGPQRLTEKQARRIAWDNFLSRLDQNTRTPMSVATLREFVERKFIPEHVALLKQAGQLHYGLRNEKTGEYGGMFKHILPALGELKLRDVTPSDLQQFVSGATVEKRKKLGKQVVVTRTPASSQMRLHLKNALSAIFEHAIAIEWLGSRNPAKSIKLPEMQRKQAHALDVDQAKALLEVLQSPPREMVMTAMLTSMNVAEICGLLWKNLNLTDAWKVADSEAIAPFSLVVRQQWRLGEYTSLKETARARMLPIPAALVMVFAQMKARPKRTGPDDPVFVSRNGTPVDEHNIANRHLKKAGAALGMPWLSWHCFRRTTATVADQLGAGTSDRKGILGHSTAAMAAHYVQPADHERRRQFLEQIASKIIPDVARGQIQ